MRARLVLVSVLAAATLVLAGCGGGSSSDGSAKDGGGSGDTATTADPGSGSSDSGSTGGDVDCTAVKKAAEDLLMVQLMAQIRDPQSIESMSNEQLVNLDFDQFQASMKVLHQLDGYDSPLGDPKAAIETYEDAATKAQALFEADAPTQADIDAYNESIGSTSEFLMHQTAISGALDEADC